MNHDALIEVLPHGEREAFLDQVQDLDACIAEHFEALLTTPQPMIKYEPPKLFVDLLTAGLTRAHYCIAGKYVFVDRVKANLPACGACTHGRVMQDDDMWTACRSPDCGPGARVRAYVRTHINSEAEDGIEPA